ncbi:hypothetical protein FNF29_00598 [Cafeteria roenbergensis]|uniref:SSD domain-containing protein n=1 Tax=Cafeteria roenbergensis TaxID=33653 RepID=A0A5A8CW22_CAFRO|nr:hypothetical protein FNF29_00598 [Cafeteria roenbergensis]|eukprot:KAA0157246.1 hypothetical protein FNF29_00598 [Cafeteria roenbergensis]
MMGHAAALACLALLANSLPATAAPPLGGLEPPRTGQAFPSLRSLAGGIASRLARPAALPVPGADGLARNVPRRLDESASWTPSALTPPIDQRDSWLGSLQGGIAQLRAVAGPYDLVFDEAPAELPLPFDLDRAVCIPTPAGGFVSVLPGFSNCSKPPDASAGTGVSPTASYAQGLVMPGVAVALVLLLVWLALFAALTTLCCCARNRCCRCVGAPPDLESHPKIGPVLQAAVGAAEEEEEEPDDPAALDGTHSRAVQERRQRRAAQRNERKRDALADSVFAEQQVPLGCGTRWSSRCILLLALAAAGVVVALFVVPFATLASNAPQLATASAGMGSWARAVVASAEAIGEGAVAARDGPAKQAVDALESEGRAADAARLEFAAEAAGRMGAQISRPATTAALSDLGAGIGSVEATVSGTLFWTGFGGAAVASGVAVLLVVLGVSAVCRTCRCCAACFRCSAVAWGCVGLPASVAMFAALWASALLLSDFCALPGSSLAGVALSVATSPELDMEPGPSWPFGSQRPAFAGEAAMRVNGSDAAATTAAYYLAPVEAAVAMGAPSTTTTCAALVDQNFVSPQLQQAPLRSLPGVAIQTLITLGDAADAARSADNQTAITPATHQLVVAAAEAFEAVVARTNSDLTAHFTCTSVRATAASLTLPLCQRFVDPVSTQLAFGSLGLACGLLAISLCAIGPCMLHPAEASTTWLEAFDEAVGRRQREAGPRTRSRSSKRNVQGGEAHRDGRAAGATAITTAGVAVEVGDGPPPPVPEGPEPSGQGVAVVPPPEPAFDSRAAELELPPAPTHERPAAPFGMAGVPMDDFGVPGAPMAPAAQPRHASHVSWAAPMHRASSDRSGAWEPPSSAPSGGGASRSSGGFAPGAAATHARSEEGEENIAIIPLRMPQRSRRGRRSHQPSATAAAPSGVQAVPPPEVPATHSRSSTSGQPFAPAPAWGDAGGSGGTRSWFARTRQASPSAQGEGVL